MDPDAIKNQIQEVLVRMGFEKELETVETYEGAASRITARLSSDANMLIGEQGVNLLALEHVVKRILHKHGQGDIRFTLDINDYRMRRLEDLKQDVKSAAKEVRLHQREVPLRPMSSFERRIVHLLLAEYPDILTESVGQEPNRRVVIKPYATN